MLWEPNRKARKAFGQKDDSQISEFHTAHGIILTHCQCELILHVPHSTVSPITRHWSGLVITDCNLSEAGCWWAQPRTGRASTADLLVLKEQEEVSPQYSQAKPAYLPFTTTLSFSNRMRVKTERREVSVRVKIDQSAGSWKSTMLVHKVTDKLHTKSRELET